MLTFISYRFHVIFLALLPTPPNTQLRWFIKSENVSTKNHLVKTRGTSSPFLTPPACTSRQSGHSAVKIYHSKHWWTRLRLNILIPQHRYCTTMCFPGTPGLWRASRTALCAQEEYRSTDHQETRYSYAKLGLGCLTTRLSFEMDGEDNMYKNEVWSRKKHQTANWNGQISFREAPEHL